MFFEKLFNNKIFKTCIISMFIAIIFFVTCAGSSVSATTEYMSFNLWNTYQNAMHIGLDYYDEYGSHSWQFCRSLDNSVNLSADNITTIQNNEFIKPDYDEYNFINNIQISVPTDKLKPAFYVGNNYLNKEISFTVQLSLKMYNGIFNTGSALYPKATLYMGENVDNYKQISCKIATFQYNFTDDTLFCKYDCKVTFKSTGFICGFWFNVGNDTGDPKGFGIHLKNNSEQPFFRATYTLSPLLFSDDISAEDIGNSVGEALKEQQENEKQEATQTGDSSVNQVLGDIPDFTTSWIKNFELLANSFAYEGTDFTLTWPEFNIPALNVNGVKMGPFKVWDALTIDAESVITDVVPSVLLKVAQILFTIALSLFCVIEVMDIILSVLSSFKVRVKG